ncbi:MAG TPA: WD40 repeat domain-containing protein, partial [Phycisphaerales bacterium]|nr:WD40 repeat domain-containing protein [Phycisphaerales bacterium]
APSAPGEPADTEVRFAAVGHLGARIITQSPTPLSRLLAFNVIGITDGVWHGQRFITVGNDGHVRCWDARPDPAQVALRPHRSWVFSTEFSPDGRRLATTGGDGFVRMWDPRTGALHWERPVNNVEPTPLRPPPRTRMLRWVSPELFVTAAVDGMLRYHDASDGRVLETVAAGRGEMFALAVSRDGTRIATACTDRAVRVWNAQTRKLDWEATGLQVFARGLAFSPDGSRLYSGGAAAGVTVWDTATHQRLTVLPTSTAPWSIAASPDGKRIGVGTMEAGVDIIELETGARIGGPSGHLRVVASVVFSPDSALLFSGGDDGTVKVWEASRARLLSSIESGLGEVPSVGLSPEGSLLAFGCQGRTAIVRDLYYHDRHVGAMLEAAILQYGKGVPEENLQLLRRRATAERLGAGQPSGSAKATGD